MRANEGPSRTVDLAGDKAVPANADGTSSPFDEAVQFGILEELVGFHLRLADDPVLQARVRLLEQEKDAADGESEWASIDKETVTRAFLAPYGVETAGVLGSERLDMANCSRFHPVMGMDYSSVCVR